MRVASVSLISCSLIVTWIIIVFSCLLVIVVVYGCLGVCWGGVYPTWWELVFLLKFGGDSVLLG